MSLNLNRTVAPILKHITPSVRSPVRFCQRRWAQVHDVRFVASHTRPEKVTEKYREKLEQKAKQQGLENVDALKEAYQDKIQRLRKQALVPGATAPLSPQSNTSSISYQPPPPPPTPQSQQTLSNAAESKRDAKIKTLDDFIDVDKTSHLPQKEIEALWRLRHIRDGQSLCAVMQTETYKRIVATAKRHPQFILPLPREGQGAEIHFLQWTFPSPSTVTILFTHLAEFKTRGEFAQPHTTVTHHLDLSETNGLVLMEGRTMENRGITVDESKWLLMCLQKFYGFEALSDAAAENANRRRKLMEQFSGGDEAFSIEALLEEAEKVP